MPYELLENEEPQQNMLSSIGKEVGRHAARTASNVGSLTIGFPGDIFSLVNEFIAKPTQEAITGKKGASYEETPLGKVIPTTETHRKNLEEGFGDILKPKNKIEQWVDDVVEDTTLIMNPSQIIKKGLRTGSKLFRNLAKSIGANVVGETVKQNAQNETAGDITKAGSLLILSLIDQESAAKQVGKLYSTAESHLPANAKTNASSLNSHLNALEYKITKNRPRGNLSPPETFVVAQSDKIKNLIQNGEINVEQAVAQKRSLNKELATLYKEVPKSQDQKSVRNMAKQLNGYLNETISNYGRTNPNFYKPYKNADQAYGTLAKSNFISHWVENNVVQHPVTSGLMHLFGPVAKTTAIAALPYQAVKLTYRIGKSPTLAKIYGNTLRAAAKEDSVAFNKYLQQLDKGLQEEESEDEYEFID